MPANRSLTFKRLIARPPAEVYRAWTRSSVVRSWLSDGATLEARRGGRCLVWWNGGYHSYGEFAALVPEKKVAFTWEGPGEPGPTRVQVTLRARGEGTALTLVHSGLGAGKKWAAAAEGFAHEWESALDNLKSVLETGEDLRIVRRPMLGILNGSELDAETAVKLGVPVKAGIRIGGTVEGMGAQAAGLQAGDVIVKMGRTKITAFGDFGTVMDAHHADDVIPVTFYRGAKKETRPMKLSRRPLPEMPATAAELAEKARGMFDTAQAGLVELFKDVSEAEAGRRPAPQEWSAKEVLAHLLTGERGAQNYLSEMVTDTEPLYDNYDNDLDVRPRSVLAVYPTVADLLAALRQAKAETVALLAALTPEIVARKSVYWRMCFILLAGGPTHDETHFDQIRSAITAARRA